MNNATNNTMHYKGYTASMNYDAEDMLIIARVLDIADVITFHGESVADLQRSLHPAKHSPFSPC